MTRRLFLHEYIDIVGQGAWRYMEHATTAEATQVPTWSCSARGTRWASPGGGPRWSTSGRSPRRVGRLVRQGRPAQPQAGVQHHPERLVGRGVPDPDRRLDRMLAGAPGCPGIDDLRRRGVKGTLFVHEHSTVRPGAGPDYLAAMAEEWVPPLLAEYGHTPVGLYEVMLRDTEVITVWATTPTTTCAWARPTTAPGGSPTRRPRVWRPTTASSPGGAGPGSSAPARARSS